MLENHSRGSRYNPTQSRCRDETTDREPLNDFCFICEKPSFAQAEHCGRRISECYVTILKSGTRKSFLQFHALPHPNTNLQPNVISLFN